MGTLGTRARNGKRPAPRRVERPNAALRELKEALEQQAATAEILRALSRSSGDPQPVFKAIVEQAHRLCGAVYSILYRYDGENMSVAASSRFSSRGVAMAKRRYPAPPSRDHIVGRAILDGRAMRSTDLTKDARFPANRNDAFSKIINRRAVLVVPLLRKGSVIGAISVGRAEAKPYTENEIRLLQTFAEHAVIAIEKVHLLNETKEALERQTATAEILKVIASSPSDVQPVFDAIAKSALRLIGGTTSAVTRVVDGMQHLAAFTTASEAGDQSLQSLFPARIGDLNSGRAITTRAPAYRIDTENDPDIPAVLRANARARGYRSILAVPMLRDGVAIGAISVSRAQPGAFSSHQIGLLSTFADQAVIAIENVRLFNETKEALEQQTGTSQVLSAISGSPTDVAPVYETILDNATRLCEASFAVVFLYDGEYLRAVAQRGATAAFAKHLEEGRLRPSRETATRLAALERRIVQVEDLLNDPHFAPADAHRAENARAVLSVPMLREGALIGVLTVWRREPRRFSDKQVALLKTFADQAVIAIENVRLFNETKEALEQQTAISEVLRVISDSPTDVKPVLDAVAVRAAKICEASDARIWLIEGGSMRYVAGFGDVPMPVELDKSLPLNRGTVSGRAILERAPVHVEDMAELTREDYPISREMQERSGFRTILSVPLMREQRALGAIMVRRMEVRSFTDKQIALLKTFADQAAIAIENTRLFGELQARTEALSKSVGQLTALGEVGQAISSSLDLETVLSTIVARSVQLTGLDSGAIYEYDEGREEFHLRAAENMSEEIIELLRKTPIKKGDGAVGGTAVARQPVQIPEIQDESYRSRFREVLIRTGRRALLAVPLMRDEHIIGALAVQRNTPGPFGTEIVELLNTFATQSAMAIQNARLFREIAEKGKQLEVASQHKSQFLASMSHELRTPLNALLGFNEMLLGDVYGEVPGEMQPPLAQMQSSGKHLLRLINNVLDLAKIEAGRMELALADYSVQDTVESVRSTLQPLAADKGLEFVAAVPADIPLAYGDPGRITQCLMNLAGNSLKFTKAGKVEISVTMSDGRLRYCVADTGIGIPSDKIDGLFTEFKQTDATVASEYGGTGLGLSISKKFVEMHGGRIWAQSEPGKGSVFAFEIPLRAGAT